MATSSDIAKGISQPPASPHHARDAVAFPFQQFYSVSMTLEGIFGAPLSVSVSFVILFVVYGTFMDAAGGGNFWLDLSLATMGRTAASAGNDTLITAAVVMAIAAISFFGAVTCSLRPWGSDSPS
jgi:TRAP-type uncharacterized transport system fused permease subunit